MATMVEAPARPPDELVDARVAKVRASLAERNVEAVLVTGFENKGWVSAFTTGVFIAPGGAIIISQEHATFITSHVDYEECLHGVPHMTTVPFDHFNEELHDRVAPGRPGERAAADRPRRERLGGGAWRPAGDARPEHDVQPAGVLGPARHGREQRGALLAAGVQREAVGRGDGPGTGRGRGPPA